MDFQFEKKGEKERKERGMEGSKAARIDRISIKQACGSFLLLVVAAVALSSFDIGTASIYSPVLWLTLTNSKAKNFSPLRLAQLYI